MKTLCFDINERCVGSEGNRSATHFVSKMLNSFGWKTQMPEFCAIDWIDGGATLKFGDADFKVLPSPYSLGCSLSAKLVHATNAADLENTDCNGQILLLHGEIAQEQLMPKNFIFYNPDDHKKIIALLEAKKPQAIVCATTRNSALAGGVYPFPLIEDGDFDIPSVYMTEEEGLKLLPFIGKTMTLRSKSDRIPGFGCNVIGTKGSSGSGKVVVTAHIDSKKGTPGAIDNATGVTVLLLLSEMLKNYSGIHGIELVALNGEDYFSVPGQMDYVSSNQHRFSEISLNINIDGAGYFQGPSCFSFFDLPDYIHKIALDVISETPGLVEGPQWPQGDHSIFVQYGRPAIAVSSQWFIENMNDQDITHTPKDNLDIVDCRRLAEIAHAVKSLILCLTGAKR